MELVKKPIIRKELWYSNLLIKISPLKNLSINENGNVITLAIKLDPIGWGGMNWLLYLLDISFS